MAPVPAGEFLMGSAGAGARPDEQPQHRVRLGAFWMQTHEVTWDAYLLFMFADQAKEREHPDALVDALSRPTAPHLEMSFGRGNNGFPAISMTQHAANTFAQWLSAKTGEYYRLPTEAEWEYACRAGSAKADAGPLEDYAWFAKNSALPGFAAGTYHTIGTKKPNAWGLYDMLGNVMEWTLDQYAPYTAAPTDNPWVKSTAPYPHAVRGGSWHDDETGVRCTARVPSDRFVEEAGSATAQEHLVHDRRAVAWLPPRPPRHPAQRRRDVSRLAQRRRTGPVLTLSVFSVLLRVLVGFSFAIVALAGLTRPELQRYEAVEPHMGTLVRITIYAPGERVAQRRVRRRLRSHPSARRHPLGLPARQRAESASPRPPSVVRCRSARICSPCSPGRRSWPRRPAARSISRRGPSSGSGARLGSPRACPIPPRCSEAATRSGFRKLHLDAERRTVTFDIAGMALDVGAIGKGYAASAAIEVLDGLGVSSALVALSGDLAFSEAPPGQRGWRIGVHSGDPSIVSVPRVLELTNAAVSTSGSSEQHLDIDGRRYSHIIDPSSGMGLVDDITVTVIARHGLDADGLDTAISVLGADRGLALIESRPDAAALIIQRTTAGTTVLASSRFLALLR